MIEADFSDNKSIVCTDRVWQYDKGIELCVKGLSSLSQDTEFHFEKGKNEPAIVKTGEYSPENNTVTVVIPSVFFEHTNGENKRVWVYQTQGEERFTEAEIIIPVRCRARPDDYVSPDDPSDETVIEIIKEAVINDINALLERRVYLNQTQVQSMIDESIGSVENRKF